MGFKEYNTDRLIDKNTEFGNDEIDVDSEIDSDLGLRENLDRLENKLETSLREKQPQGRVKSFEYGLEAREIHEDRSERAQRVDENRQAEEQLIPGEMTKDDFQEWKDNPGELDIEGVDGRGQIF